MIFFTELQNLPIYGVKGEFLGEMEDLCVDPGQKAGAGGLLSDPYTGRRISVYYLLTSPIHLRARRPNECGAG